jgi:hypothetical protein
MRASSDSIGITTTKQAFLFNPRLQILSRDVWPQPEQQEWNLRFRWSLRIPLEHMLALWTRCHAFGECSVLAKGKT